MDDRCALNTAHPSSIQTSKPKPVIVCGDLNVAANPIDLANPQANRNNPGFSQQERDKFANLISSGFVDSFRHLHPDEVKYSWWSYRQKARERNVGWRIDYFLVSNRIAEKIMRADILDDVLGSDHAPIILEIDI